MDVRRAPSEADRELHDLRMRAYGPNPDIDSDPVALARLLELEAARAPRRMVTPAAEANDAPAAWSPPSHKAEADSVGSPREAGDASPTSATESGRRSPWKRVTATRSRRISLIAASIAAAVVIGYGVAELVVPHPDAVLHPTADAGGGRLQFLFESIGLVTDPSTLRGFEVYHQVQPWAFVDSEGRHCLVGVSPARTWISFPQCVPPGTELILDLGVWPFWGEAFGEGLPDGSVIRMHLRDDVVDVFYYPASEPADVATPRADSPSVDAWPRTPQVTS